MSRYFVRPSGQHSGQMAVYKRTGDNEEEEIDFGTESYCYEAKAHFELCHHILDELVNEMEMERRNAVRRKDEYINLNPTDKETERAHNAYIDGYCAALSIVWKALKES